MVYLYACLGYCTEFLSIHYFVVCFCLLCKYQIPFHHNEVYIVTYFFFYSAIVLLPGTYMSYCVVSVWFLLLENNISL